MADVAIEDQLQGIRQVARRCPEQTLIWAYRRACVEFARQTRWLRVNITGDTVAGQQQYTLGSDDTLDIIGIRAMKAQSAVLRSSWPLSPLDGTKWNPNMANGQPRWYTYVPEGQFALFTTPDAAYALTITVECVPKDDVVTVPDMLLTKWRDGIEAGALAKVLGLPGQPWSNPNLGEVQARKFQAAINNGRADVQRGFNTGTRGARVRMLFNH